MPDGSVRNPISPDVPGSVSQRQSCNSNTALSAAPTASSWHRTKAAAASENSTGATLLSSAATATSPSEQRAFAVHASTANTSTRAARPLRAAPPAA
ncbi:hypothetical protein SLS57_007014 [Botryosphaeria dothidea]